MASSSRSAKHSVSSRLRIEPYRFQFVQAVRLLEQIGSLEKKPRRPVGGSALPHEECVRLRATAALSFPPSEIAEVQVIDPAAAVELYGAKPAKTTSRAAAGEKAEENADENAEEKLHNEGRRSAELPDDLAPKMSVGFMGLYGPSGVLPQHDTQRIINAGNRKNPERDFLDVFNHRVLSLFYRASVKYRLPFAYESAYRSGDSRQHLACRILYSLAGLGTAGLLGRLEVKDELAIEFGGLLRHQPKNAVSLQQMLTSYFQLPFLLIQFVGQWLTLTEDNKSSMPTSHTPLGRNCQLGMSYIIGSRVWDISGKFRLRIGPLNLQQFEAFLPGTRNLTETAQIARLYAGNQFDFDVQLELLANCVPEIQLKAEAGSQLGFNTWLITEKPTDNKLEAIFVHSGLPIT